MELATLACADHYGYRSRVERRAEFFDEPLLALGSAGVELVEGQGRWSLLGRPAGGHTAARLEDLHVRARRGHCVSSIEVVEERIPGSAARGQALATGQHDRGDELLVDGEQVAPGDVAPRAAECGDAALCPPEDLRVHPAQAGVELPPRGTSLRMA